jgi:hypothetical protein
MATYIFKKGHLTFGGQDLSDHVRSMTLDTGIESQDKTAMGANTRQSKGGLKTASLSIEFFQDFASNELDAVIAGLTDNEVAFTIKADSGSTSATNPKWSGTGLITSYNPIAGSVGDMAVASVTLEPASDWARAESD